MAVQNLIEQHIVFITTGELQILDPTTIRANSLIQSLGANTLGNDLVFNTFQLWHWDIPSSTWIATSYIEIRCYVTVAFQTTIQQNMAALQTAFPTYRVTTWGYPVSFGF